MYLEDSEEGNMSNKKNNTVQKQSNCTLEKTNAEKNNA